MPNKPLSPKQDFPMPIKTQLYASEDRSLDIASHIESVKAIADLVATVGGSDLDGSDSKVEELSHGTLNRAMHAIRQHLELIEKIQSEQDEWIRKKAVAEMNAKANAINSGQVVGHA